MQLRCVSIILAFLAPVVLTAANQPSKSSPIQQPINSPRRDVRMHPEFATPELFREEIVVDQGVSFESASLEFFSNQSQVYKLRQPEEELSLVSESTDALGYSHLRFQQMVGDVPVWGCRVITHFYANRRFYLAAGQLLPTPEISTNPTITAEFAGGIASKSARAIGASGTFSAVEELVIFPVAGDPHLAWFVTITNDAGTIVRYRVFVDAQSGEVLQEYNDVQSDGPTSGSGPDCHDSIRTIHGYADGGVNKMINTVKPMYIPPVASLSGVITTLIGILDLSAIARDANNDNLWNDTDSLKAAISAHYYASETYDYYLNTFGRNSYDGTGGSLFLVVLDPVPANAAWYGSGIARFRAATAGYDLPWSASRDIVAHELTHGVTETSAGLIYSFQSGALNESFSDFFGVMVDRDDWIIGEELFLSPGWGVRDFAEPHDSHQPDRLSEYRSYPMSYDNGGVHVNSGIPNRAGYLVAASIGRDKAEQIWYRTLTNYLTPSSSIYFWADMTLQAAEDLHGPGSPEVLAVEAAMDSIEVGYIYADPFEISAFSVQAGTTRDSSLYLHNRSHGPVSVTAINSVLGFVSVSATLPLVLPARDSVMIDLHVDATSAGLCDIGSNPDSLIIISDAAIYPVLSVPVNVNIALVATSYSEGHSDAPAVRLSYDNTPRMIAFHHGVFSGLWGGTLMVGMLDGSDTTVYHNYGPAQHPFPPVDNISSGRAPGGYDCKSFRIGSPDGRIHGAIGYYSSLPYRVGDEEYVIVDYVISNPCDTTLELLCGVYSDFDLADPLANTAGFDSENQMIYVVGDVDSLVAGLKCLSGHPRNMLSIKNSEWVWPSGNTLKSGDAYRLMDSTGASSGSTAEDWASVLTFGNLVLAPGDSVNYRIAMMFSIHGVDGLREIARNIFPVYDSLGLYVDPPRIEWFTGSNATDSPPDTQIVIKYLGEGSVNWQASSDAQWLQLLNNSGSTGQDLNVALQSQSLSPGTYIDTIWIESFQAFGSPEIVVVELTVLSGDGIIRVPQESATIEQAFAASVDGEVIIVAPGTYPLQLNVHDKRLRLQSEMGPDSTILVPVSPASPIISFTDSHSGWSEIAGMTITGAHSSSQIYIGEPHSLSIHDNVFRDNQSQSMDLLSLIYVAQGAASVYNNIFHDNVSSLCLAMESGNGATCKIAGNTIDNCFADFDVSRIENVVKNNLVTNCEFAMYVVSPDSTKGNDLWGNNHCFALPSNDTVPGNYFEDPRYCRPQSNNFGLQPGSPCFPGGLCSSRIGARSRDCIDVFCGDPNYDHLVNISDAVFLISYIFAGGPPPVAEALTADVDCSEFTSISDAVYLIAFIFAGGGVPCQACP